MEKSGGHYLCLLLGWEIRFQPVDEYSYYFVILADALDGFRSKSQNRSTMCYLSGDLFLAELRKASVVPAHLVSVVVVS